jgi:hypothetical protein
MEYLDTIPYTPKQSVFGKLTEAVRKIFGLAPQYNTAMAEVLRVSETLFGMPAAELKARSKEFDKKLGEAIAATTKRAATAPTPANKEMTVVPSAFVKAADQFGQSRELDAFGAYISGTDVTNLKEELQTESRLERLFTRQAGLSELFERDYEAPIRKELKSLGISDGDFGMFLWAMSAPARNRSVAEVNANFPDGGSGLLTAEALKYLQGLQKAGLLDKYMQVAKKVYAARDYGLKLKVENGLESQAGVDALLNAQPFYVPLKGFAADGDMLTADTADPGFAEQAEADRKAGLAALRAASPNGSIKEFRAAYGRGSMPFHPMYNLFYDVKASIGRSLRNDAMRPALRLWRENPSMFAGVLNVYSEDNLPQRMVSRGLVGGEYEPSSDIEQEYYRKRDEYMFVKDNGKVFLFEFADTPQGQSLRRMFANMKPATLSGGMQLYAGFNNFMKSMLTHRNPLHQLTLAPFRDLFESVATAMHSQNLKGSPAYKKNLAANLLINYAKPSTWQAVTRFAFKGERPTGEAADLLDDMLRAGGAPVNARILDAQTSAAEAAKQLQTLKGLSPEALASKPRQLLDAMLAWVDGLANTVDLIARFATYRAAVDLGISNTDAARLALDSSLNVVRKGEIARTVDFVVPFFGASIESSRKLARMAKNPKTVLKVFGAFVAFGVLESMMNASQSGDEDEDGQLDYLNTDNGAKYRASRIVLFYGDGPNDYIKIPIGTMLGFFKYTGNKIGDIMMGTTTAPNASVAMLNAGRELAGSFISLVSPARVAGTESSDVFVALTPLVGKPIIENIANQNFFKSPIYTTSFPEGAPPSELGRDTTAEGWKALARAINSFTGGTEAIRGSVSFQPEVYRHLVDSWLGGPYDIAKQIVGIKDIESMSDMPVVKSFTGFGAEFYPQSRYYQNTDTLRQIMSNLNKMSDEQIEKHKAAYQQELDRRIVEAYIVVERELDNINKARRELLAADSGLTPQEREAVVENARTVKAEYYSAFNRIYNDVKRGK